MWAQRYDKQFRDIFALQDEIVKSVVKTLNVQLPLLERGYIVPRRTDNLQAYDYCLRGSEQYLRFTRESVARARELLEKAIALDPEYTDAYVALSFSYFAAWVSQWDRDPGALDRAHELAQKAVALDDSHSTAYAILGWIAVFRNQLGDAITLGNRAILLNPNDPVAHTALANIRVFAGKPEKGLVEVQKALRLDPRHAQIYMAQAGPAYFKMKRYKEALEAFKASDQSMPNVHLSLAWTYAKLGREREGRTEAAELMRLSPNFTLEQMMKQTKPANWTGPEQQSDLAELRRLGLK